MDGLPDGTFKGRKVVTRFEMAKTVARLLAKVTEIRSAGGKIGPDDALRINRLTEEFKTELALLGVRLEALEKRVDKVEKKASTLEAVLSNVRIEGFYRLENTFVFAPFNFANYPFEVGKNPFKDFTSPGLYPLSQEAYLRFIGSPFIGGALFKNVETFVELKAKVTGPSLGNAQLTYNSSNPPIAGDNLDDFATGVTDEQRVQVDKAHFITHSRLASVRAFSHESMTDLSDPGILLTIDAFDPAPFSGVEAVGSIGKLSYFGSALKHIKTESSDGNNRYDLTDFFKPVSEKINDVFSFRLAYLPYKYRKGLKGSGPTAVTVGSTYVERIFSYDKPDNFNRVIGVDFTLSHEGEDEKFDLTLEPQFSFGMDPARLTDENAKSMDIGGNAFRLDSSYSTQNFLASFKAHSFSKWFRVTTGARQYVDHNLPPYYDNFRRKNNGDDPFDPAETLGRLNLKWNLDQKVLTHLKNFSVSTLVEGKRFAVDPAKPRYDDNRWASRWFIQGISDWTDNTHVELIHEEQFHVPPNELYAGAVQKVEPIEISRLSVDFKATKHTSILGELEFLDDYNMDSIGPDGKHFSMERSKVQVNSQTNRYLFVSGYAQQIRNALLREFTDSKTHDIKTGNVIRPLARNARSIVRPQKNGLDINTFGAETNLQMFSNKVGLKTYLQREAATCTFDPTLDGTTDVLVAELGFNWTRALKARYQYGIQDTNLLNLRDTFCVNNFAELIYTPSEKTEMRLTYGYEYENPDDRFEDGPYLFFRTNKIVQLTAHTDF